MSGLRANISYSIAYQILAIILPLVTAPYIARVLGVSGVGLYSYSFAVVSSFQLIAMLGIANHGSRTIATARGLNNISIRFFEIYTIQLCMSVVMTGLYLGYCFSSFCIDKHMALILVLYMISGAIDISWLFFGVEEFKLTVLRNAIFKLLTTLCVFIFVQNQDDIYLYTWIISIGTLISFLYLWLYLPKFVHRIYFSWRGVIANVRPVLVLFIPILSFSVYKILSKILLGSMGSIDEVGFFENASKLLNVPLGFISAIGTVMLPRITTLLKNHQQKQVDDYMEISISVNTIVLSAIVFGLIAVSDPLIDLFFGVNFHRSALLLRVLSISLLFTAWSSVIRTQYLIPLKYDKIYVSATILGALLNLISNVLLIPYLGSLGAAISSVIAEVSIWVVYILFIRKQNLRLKIFFQPIKYIVIGLLMYLFLRYYIIKEDCSWIELLKYSLIGAIFYSIFSFITLKYTDKKIYELIFNNQVWKRDSQ